MSLTDKEIPDALICFRDDRGRIELRRELSSVERSSLVARSADLQAALAPYEQRDRIACAAAVSGMIGAFAMMHRHNADAAAAITAAYLWTVRYRPRWAIEKVCSAIRQGTAGLAPQYCPNEPELNIAIGKVLEPYRTRLDMVKAVLEARVSKPQ